MKTSIIGMAAAVLGLSASGMSDVWMPLDAAHYSGTSGGIRRRTDRRSFIASRRDKRTRRNAEKRGQR